MAFIKIEKAVGKIEESFAEVGNLGQSWKFILKLENCHWSCKVSLRSDDKKNSSISNFDRPYELQWDFSNFNCPF